MTWTFSGKKRKGKETLQKWPWWTFWYSFSDYKPIREHTPCLPWAQILSLGNLQTLCSHRTGRWASPGGAASTGPELRLWLHLEVAKWWKVLPSPLSGNDIYFRGSTGSEQVHSLQLVWVYLTHLSYKCTMHLGNIMCINIYYFASIQTSYLSVS